ncbi:hypothetical protein [Herbiconiux solani]|uniref:hypothetical protein n=1 Tax=Herbiconiux solani TaxID=661329 RepID=UPI000826F953|nr:hypothetical protein [Herbiconiux solani]
MSGAGERVGRTAERARGRWAAAVARRKSVEGLEPLGGHKRLRWWEKIGLVFDALDVFSLFR